LYSVRAILASRQLPNELVLAILDYARYWVEKKRGPTDLEVLMDEEFSRDYSAAYPHLVVSAFPITLYPESEPPKIKEIEFCLVSHDQGWTTEDTRGTYTTSSFWEISILRPETGRIRSGRIHEDVLERLDQQLQQNLHRTSLYRSVESATQTIWPRSHYLLLPRPCSKMEPQRLHCNEMINLTTRENDFNDGELDAVHEGKHAWYLQGNEAARGVHVFDGEMVPRRSIVWSCKANLRWVGDDGTGRGEDFVDSLQQGDCIVLWARAKRRGWENHIYGARVTIRYNI
ncbi:hypothetical protein EK21DRAFT_63415, partial [Setomelanomma holmii]